MRTSNRNRKNPSQNRRDPFAKQPDRRFYYAFEAFEQRLAILRRLIRGSDAIILVVGDPGSGKTTLLQRILDTSDHPWKPCRVQTAASTALGRLSGRKQKGGPTAFLLKKPGGTVVLMDDVHRLSRRELRKLLRDTLAADPGRKIKRVVLFGNPRFSENFDAVSGGLVDETAVNKIFLPTITAEEAAAFIRHRMAVAGFTGKNPFTPAVLKKLYDRSAGVPGRINDAAGRWWTQKGYAGISRREGFRHERVRVSRAIGWSATAVAAAVLAGGMWMLSDGDRRTDRSPAAQQQVVRIKIDGAGGQLRPRGEIAAGSPAVKAPSPIRQTTRPALPKKVQQQSAPLNNRSDALPAAAPSEQPDRDRPEQIRREAWLLAQNPAGYTIQLLGVRNEQSLLEFVANYRLNRSGQAAYYRSRFKGGVWYPLVYGTYPTVDEARQAVTELPEAIRYMSPWIRKMSAVHAEIRKAAKP